MIKNISAIFYILILFFSCTKSEETKDAEIIKPTLIKIGYYPTFHQSAETIVNLNEKYILFYSPVSYIPEPFPEPNKNEEEDSQRRVEHKKYLAERPKLVPFQAVLNEKDVENINIILSNFSKDDFIDDEFGVGIDGMSTNIIIYYSDGKIVQINSITTPKENQYRLYSEILNILKVKNKSENNTVILDKIIGYH